MADRLLVDLGADDAVRVMVLNGELPSSGEAAALEWPLDGDALEDLRWYLEDYLTAPFGVYEDRGARIAGELKDWGQAVFGAVFESGPARDAYVKARTRGDVELVFRSNAPALLALPWELMADPGRDTPVALDIAGVSRSLLMSPDAAQAVPVPEGKLRVLMVISRPSGVRDVGYQMIARPLLQRLEAVRGQVELVVLRPPTLDALRAELKRAADAGMLYQVVHFDGHGVMPGRPAGGNPLMFSGAAGEGVLVFEKPGGGADRVAASVIAQVLKDARVPVVVLNACQSGAVGKELEAAVATRLLREGVASVVAMAYSVYAVAAAEFMAAFYERLFAAGTVAEAVTAGRKQMFRNPGRPSPKGDLPLKDWLVPVHYFRRDVSFPQAEMPRPTELPSLADALAGMAESADQAGAEGLDPVGGVFIGRDALFYDLETAARLRKVVVLTGPGGTGKTELAKAFGRWWRDTGGVSDPQLVRWHSFEPGVASFGLDGVITEIGLAVFGTEFARLEAPQRLAAVKQLLGQYRALLIWDNFESAKEMPDPAGATPALGDRECGALKEFLAWVREHSKSAVLITSRAQEGWLGEVGRIGVGGLNRAESAQYATHLLAPFPAAQRKREQRAFGELLEWLDGHPLSMRLTLPRLAESDPAILLAGLRDTIPVTDGDRPEGRLSSLDASITYSFAHLSERTRRLLPAVSHFHGIADANVLMLMSGKDGVPRRFAGISYEEWRAVLEDAARVGLLTNLGGMYQVHPALPGYLAAAWRAENPNGYVPEWEAGKQALCAACAAFGRWLTGQIESGDAALAYTIIGLQRRTLGAMLGHALDHQAWSDAEGIVRSLDYYWESRGLGEEAAAWADRTLDATAGFGGQGPAEVARSLWLYTITQGASRQMTSGHPDQAAHTYRQALAYLETQPATDWTRRSISAIYHQLGVTAQHRGRLDEAEDWYRKSLAIKEGLGNRPGMASSYHQLGNTAHQRSRLDEAEGWYRKSLAISEGLGNRPGMANSYHQLGSTAQLRGRLDEAEDWYRKSLAIKERLGDSPGMALTYGQLGNTAKARRCLDEAEGWYRKSLAISEGLGNRPGMAGIYQQLGMIAQLRGRLDEASDWYRKSLAIKDELDDRVGMALTYGVLGLLAEERGHARLALEWYARVVSLFDEFPSPLTRTAPDDLARLTLQLGIPALQAAWRSVTGQDVPQAMLDYVAAHGDEAPPG